MIVLSVAEMRKADAFTISQGKSEEELIYSVGKAVADEINARFSKCEVLCCLGKGNNGKDGKVCAENLSSYGFTVYCFNAEKPDYSLFDREYGLIVDALFGTGLNREVSGDLKTAIDRINDLSCHKISVDIPSGLNGDNGLIMGACVKADETFAVQFVKRGLLLSDGKDCCGKIKVLDVGIMLPEGNYIETIEGERAKSFFLPRKNNVNKGNFGKVSVVGGSREFSGSVLLSLNSLIALKSGAGYANLTVPKSLYSAYLGLVPECTFGFLGDKGGHVVFDEEGLKGLLKYDAICIGMGMGTSEDIYDSIVFLLKNYTGNLLIDADGLNSLAKYGVDALKNKKCTVVLTPHVKEFSRLSGKTVDEILKDPVFVAKEFASSFGVTLLLKSVTSVITDGEKTFFNVTGTNALSKGGSGDALSGFIAGMLLKNGETVEKVAVANYVFGKAAEIATYRENEYTVTASDVIESLPFAINSL